MKLAVFDFDSTLMDGETLDIIAKETEYYKEIKEITEKGMKGEIDFFESLISRVALLEGMKLKKVNEICESLPIMNGAKETIKELKNKNYKCVCFSGGFKNATLIFVEKLKLDGEFSNIFHTKNNILTGKVGGEMMFSDFFVFPVSSSLLSLVSIKMNLLMRSRTVSFVRISSHI